LPGGKRSFGTCSEVFDDRIVAAAILDRQRHRAVTMNIRSSACHQKDKLKAGLIRSRDDNASQQGGEL
jgi:hypothetical protein